MTAERRKKICFVSLFAYGIFNPKIDLKFGGSETQMYFLAKELAKDFNFEANFVVLDVGQKKEEDYGGVKIVKAYKRGGGLVNALTGFLKLTAVLKKLNPDIVVCRAFGREVGVSALYAKIFRKKLIYSFAHDKDVFGDFFKGFSGQIFKFGFLSADYYVAQSEYQSNEFKKRFKNKVGKIVVIKNSWPEESFVFKERKFILWVGSSSVLKRPEIFLRLAGDFPEENFVMIMTESKMNKKAWEEISVESRKLGNLCLLKKVSFEKIGRYFSQAKILVSTSSSEGFPNVFLQAGAAKTPILSLKVDPDGFIEKEKCGIICHNDYEELKAGLKKLLREKEFYNQAAKNCFDYLKSEHGLEKNIATWKEVFKKL
jgi:glycosyltransferase involved in cell wall biosynthesis